MKLLVDIGNTRVKWSLLDQHMIAPGSFLHKAGDLSQLLSTSWSQLPSPESVHIANVGPKALEATMSQWIQQQWHCPVSFVHSTAAAAGVTNGYTNPSELGVDRWLAMIAVRHRVPGNVYVFDCGTAITLDYMTADGHYEGGLIFPGLTLLQSTVVANTAVRIAPQQRQLILNNQFVEKNATDGIQQGGFHTALAILEYEAARLTRQCESAPTFVITGGDAEILLPHLTFPCHHEPQLVLQGLAHLVQNN